ncbi:LOW QUALITY PROTEIN: MAP7 domain-containing protein 3 [Gracilinanus agilis]|uniref:LOW QUALITY PROTEIN: MAP7 domain-containing protein 3 n=1 Tax=Gracilinanus agilis TaxID=191870 RepID=UPI001CFE776D|nr:LOW QUALITY PROTEIN: MAP7 domain-containing protein 3 [Gracilinanus agilis]
MADAGGIANSGTSLKGMREQLVEIKNKKKTTQPTKPTIKLLRESAAAAQAIAEERRNQSGTAIILAPSSNLKTSTKPVIDGSILKSDERQRLARERREELGKQQAFKEIQLLEKEKKAKRQYEKQIEERQRKIKEQKEKEQQRRAAVEEKRRQKLDEEKEHFEAMVNRTLERSNRLEQRQKRWSWGGSVTPDSDSKSGLSSATPPNPVDLVDKLPSSTEPQTEQGGSSGNKHTSSTLNLRPTDSVISKRLSSSSATLPNSDKTRRFQISALENSIITRLLTPTQASLARCKNAAVLSAAGRDPSEFHSCPRSAVTGTFSQPLQASRISVRSRSIDRLKSSTVLKSEVDKHGPTHAAKRSSSPSLSTYKRPPSPANVKHPPSPSAPNKVSQRSRPPSPSTLKQLPSSPTTGVKPVFKPIQRPLITPTVISIPKKSKTSEIESKSKDKCEARKQELQTSPASEKAVKTKEVEPSNKTGLETISAEEAAKILMAKQEFVQDQKDQEEGGKDLKEEEERKVKEDTEKKEIGAEEERDAGHTQLGETSPPEEQKQKTEEDQEKLAAELQQQKEEAEVKAQEEAARQRRERERIMEQSVQERLERKKRIEEIMKRTRKVEQNSEQSEEKSKNEAIDEDDAVEADKENLETVDPLAKVTETDSPEDVKPSEELSATMPPQVANEIQTETAASDETVELITNGNETAPEPENSGPYLDMTLATDTSLSAKDAVTPNSEIVDAIKTEHTSDLNGKSDTWTFEEIIDLEEHAKTTQPNSNNTPDSCTQNSDDAATFTPSPKLAFEEDSVMNPLTTSAGSN